MNKLGKDLYIQHSKRLKAIVNEQSTFAPFLTRPDFKEVIKTELNVLAACEKLFPKVTIPTGNSANSLALVFNKITKENFETSKYKYDDEADLIDQINYLVTFCNNMFKVQLDDLVSGKKVTATDPHIDLKAKPEFDDQTPRMNPNLAFAGGIPLAATPYENPYLLGKAYAKLNDDISKGAFYRYKTKPKAIVIAKQIAFVVSILVIIALFVSAILAFIATGLEIKGDESTNPQINYIMNGIFYLVAGGFGIYPLVITSPFQKNPNKKYFFNWGFLLMFVILALLFTMMDLIPIWIGWEDAILPETVGSMHYNAFLGLKYSLLLTTILSGLTLIPVIIGGVCNPKPDPEAVERKVREYVDLFSGEMGSAPVPPKADVQEPASVKVPKKDTKSSKSKTKSK